MRYFDKFFLSIKSYYLNDNKYHNSLFSNLRIYFERETKHKSTITTFGNTFRNSKWSDLQKINIKESFLKTFIYASLTFVLLISLLMCSWGKTKSEQYLGFIPFFSIWDASLNYALVVFNELQSYLFLSIFGLITSAFIILKNQLPNFILNLFYNSFVVNRVRDKQFFKPQVKKLKNSPLANTETFKSSSEQTSDYINTFYKLSVLQNSINHFKSVGNLNTRTSTNLFLNKQHPLFFIKSSYSHTNANNNTVTRSESFYSTNLNPTKIFNLPSNLKNIQNHTGYHKSLTYFDFNLLNNLNLGKEQRWLTKNSILTEFLNKNTNAFTQSKKLLGLSHYNNALTNKNLWLPTKLSNLSNTEALSYINNLNNTLYPSIATKLNSDILINNQALKPSLLLNLNFFENSRIWVTKKFFFTNQMLHNLPISFKYYNSSHKLNSALEAKTSSPLNYFKPSNSLTNSINDFSTILWTRKSISPTVNSTAVNRVDKQKITINTQNLDILSNNDLAFIVNLTSNTKSYENVNYCSVYPSKFTLNNIDLR